MIQKPVRLVLGMVLALTTLLAGERASATPSALAPPPTPVDVETLTAAKARRLTAPQVRSLVDEPSFVRGATSVGGLTAAEARRIYWHAPELILSIPTSITTQTTTTATPTGSTAAPPRVLGCTVRTRRRVRNHVGFVIFSFTFHKHWFYNGSRVLNPSHRHSWNVTGWGEMFGWHFNGIIDEQQRWIPFSRRLPRYGHHSERTAQFATAETPVGAVTRNVRRYVTTFANGDWATPSDVGSPGCGD